MEGVKNGTTRREQHKGGTLAPSPRHYLTKTHARLTIAYGTHVLATAHAFEVWYQPTPLGGDKVHRRNAVGRGCILRGV